MKNLARRLAFLANFMTGKDTQSTLEQTDPSSTYSGGINTVTAGGAQSLQSSPPFYPSPWMTPGTLGWEDAYVKAKDFVSQLTLMEKVNITTGVGYVHNSFSKFH